MKLGLGTVQFGTDYGISNHSGQTAPSEVAGILDFALAQGISYLDTAPAYGNSESVLGQFLTPEHNLRIVTKTDRISKSRVNDQDVELVLSTFRKSIQNLNQDSVYGLLVHHPGDLLADGGDKLFSALESLKAEGLVQKIGVSVYNQSEIEQLLDRYIIDLIQVPLNVFDRRLLKDGYLQSIKTKNSLEIHVRSVFLQGLLLMNEVDLPAYFVDLIPHLSSYRRANEERGISHLQAAIGFVNQIEAVDTLLVGVNNLDQLKEIVCALDPDLDLSYLATHSVESEYLINPFLWRK
jgi:aryl-alcohol dehydrogenase-like predicted oxidoreductase